MKITKEQYDGLNEAAKALCSEDGDGFTMDFSSMKTQGDVDAVKKAKDQAKREQKEAQDELKTLKAEKDTLTDKLNVYENDADLKLSKEQLIEFEALKRQKETLTADNEELTGKYTGLKNEMTTAQIKDALGAECEGIIDSRAKKDVIASLADKFVLNEGKLLTNETLGDKSGLDAKAYLTSYVEDGRDYLKPKSSGGGAGGGTGSGGGSQGSKSEGLTLFSDN